MSNDIASLGIKADATQVDAAAQSLDRLVTSGTNAERQTLAIGNAAERMRAQLQAANVSAADIDRTLAKLGMTAQDTTNKAASGYSAVAAAAQAASAQVGAAAAAQQRSADLINASVGLTDVAFKSASASAAVFGQSLIGLSALQASTRTAAQGLTAELLVLKAAQDGLNWAKDIENLLGIDVAFKSAKDSAAVFSAELVALEATGTAVFATLQQGFNASLGLTDVAFKSASASASVFAQSLEGLAAIEASAAEGMSAIAVTATEAAAAQEAAAASANAFALAWFKALTGVSDAQLGVAATATEEAAVVIAANSAMAASAVESAAVQVAANETISGSSIKVRETLVAVREIARGDFTRLAGSLSILAQAFGVLYAALVPIAVIAVVVGGALALVKNQINEGVNGSGDLTRSLGLTADQLERVKDRYVTFGDTIKAVFQVIGERLSGAGIGHAWQSFWDGVAWVIEQTMEYVVGTVLGGVRIIEEAWKIMPTFLGGEGSTAGIDFAKAFKSGLDDAKSALNNFYSDVANVARQNAVDRILKQAGKEPKTAQDSAVNQADKMLQQINDQTAAYGKYDQALLQGSATLGTVLDQQKTDSALKSVIAKIELDTKLTLEQKLGLIKELRGAQTELNAAEAEFAVLQQSAHNSQELSILEKEVETLDMSNVQRAKAIALLKAQQELENKKISPTSAQGKQFIDSAVNVAAGQASAKEATDAYNSSLTLQSTLLDEIATHAQKMTSTLTESFGHVGTAIADMTKALTDYSAQQAKFAEEQAALDKLRADNNPDIAKEIELSKAKKDADTEYYADVLGSAKNFFAQGSAGYKVLQAAETAYRAYQLVSSISAIAAKWTETTAVVAANTVQTGSAATTAVANAAADVPFPFNLGAVATVVALLAGFGILAGGGGGGSAAPVVDIAKDQQAAQGSGSVLGDATAKSDSIAKSLTDLAKDTNADLNYSNQMVISLKAIQTGIGSLTGLLARQLQVGGLFNTSSLGLGSTSSGGSGLIGGLISSIFGSSSSSTTLLDQGIRIAGTTIGDAIKGVAASAYQSTQTKSSSSSFFGLFSSSSTTNKTTNTPLSSDFTDQISSIVGGLRSTVLDAATKLGIDGAQAVVDSLTLNIGSISFKDMTGSQIQDALNAVFSKLGDQIAEAAVPVVTQLQQVGEGALETLARLANEYQAVDDAAKTVGFTFSQVGVDSLAARDQLIQFSGGLDQFTSQANFFVSNFETSAAALAPIVKSVDAEMTRLGLSGVTTKNQFSAVVQSLDTSTVGGAKLYAALMMVAPAFAKVADAAANLADTKNNMEIKLLQDQGDALGATALQREKELAALDDSLKPLQMLIYATEDLNTAQAALNALTIVSVSLTQNVTDAHTALATAYNNESQALTATKAKFQSFVDTLAAFRQQLDTGQLAANDPLRQYAATRSAFTSIAAAAKVGDQTALGQLEQVSTDFLTASKAASGTSQQYNNDLAAVKNAVSDAAKSATGQVTIAQQQLDALTASVDGLGIVNESVLSVRDAINNLTIATAAQKSAADAAVAKAQDDVAKAEAAKQNASAGVSQGSAASASTAQDASGAALAAQTAAAVAALSTQPAPVTAPTVTSSSTTQDYIDMLYNQAYSGNSDQYGDNSTYQFLSALGWPHTPKEYDDAVKSYNAARAGLFNSHANGLSNVPYDNYFAKLHKNERVLTAPENAAYSQRDNAVNDMLPMLSELRALRHDLAIANKKIDKNTGDTLKLLRAVSDGGTSINTKVAT